MTTIATLISRVRSDLKDPSAERWSDATLQRHLEHAIREYSLAEPRQRISTIATTSGSRQISVASLMSELVEVTAVEWKAGEFPPSYQRFQVWESTLTMVDAEGDGSNAYVYWLSLHAIDGSTHPVRDDEILAVGAAYFALREWSVYSVNRVTVMGDDAADDYRALYQWFERVWQGELESRKRRLRRRLFYVPAEPLPSQTSDPGVL